jgi:hypothetical protein
MPCAHPPQASKQARKDYLLKIKREEFLFGAKTHSFVFFFFSFLFLVLFYFGWLAG